MNSAVKHSIVIILKVKNSSLLQSLRIISHDPLISLHPLLYSKTGVCRGIPIFLILRNSKTVSTHL